MPLWSGYRAVTRVQSGGLRSVLTQPISAHRSQPDEACIDGILFRKLKRIVLNTNGRVAGFWTPSNPAANLVPAVSFRLHECVCLFVSICMCVFVCVCVCLCVCVGSH